MSIFDKPFDARTVAPQEAFEPLPAGWYTAMIVEAEEKDNSAKSGKYLELKMEIMGGDYNKRMIWDRLNLINPNDQAQDIAYRTFSAICHATGVLVVTNPQELYAKPMLIQVKVRAARNDAVSGKDYDASNEVKGYKAIDTSKPPVTGPTRPSTSPGASAGNGPSTAPAWATAGAAVSGAAPAAPVVPPPAWAAAAAPVAAPAVVVPPAVPVAPVVVPIVAAVFPPEGWTAHPTAPGYFYKGQEVLTEDALRATLAPPAPVIPPAPAVPPVPPVAVPTPAPAVGGAPPWAGQAGAPAVGGTPPWAKAA